MRLSIGGRGLRWWFAAGIAWLVQVALYLAFAANLGWRECIAAVLAGAIATLAVVVLTMACDVEFILRWRDMAQAWRMPWYLLAGTGEVLHGLMRQMFTREGTPSRVAAVRIDVGAASDPAEQGRRALAVTLTTATPNFVVLGLIHDQQLMLYHQIMPGKIPVMTRKLGAGS